MVASLSLPSAAIYLDWLFTGAIAPLDATASAAPATAVDDLDFLDAPADEMPSWPPLAAQPTDPERHQQALQWLSAEALEVVVQGVDRWLRDPRLPGIDRAAALVTLTAMVQPGNYGALAHGPLSLLIKRILLSNDGELAQVAARAALGQRLDDVQEALAGHLEHNGAQLGLAGRGELLAALEVLGDGRCVRAMESFLALWSSRLQDHEAWRARHIVQVIRRGGRR